MQSSQSTPNTYQTWDYQVTNGLVPILSDSGAPNSAEDAQSAMIATFVQVGTIPQLPEYGVDWLSFFTGEISIGVIDSSIKQNLSNAGLNFLPSYDLINGNLVVTVVNQ